VGEAKRRWCGGYGATEGLVVWESSVWGRRDWAAVLGRRRDLMGVWAPVEKEVRWSRRWPSIDFGSGRGMVSISTIERE
jgi:hypothetical protein